MSQCVKNIRKDKCAKNYTQKHLEEAYCLECSYCLEQHLFLDLACIFKFVQIADNGLNKKRNKKTVIPLLLFFCFKFVPL